MSNIINVFNPINETINNTPLVVSKPPIDICDIFYTDVFQKYLIMMVVLSIIIFFIVLRYHHIDKKNIPYIRIALLGFIIIMFWLSLIMLGLILVI